MAVFLRMASADRGGRKAGDEKIESKKVEADAIASDAIGIGGHVPLRAAEMAEGTKARHIGILLHLDLDRNQMLASSACTEVHRLASVWTPARNSPHGVALIYRLFKHVCGTAYICV